MKLNTGGLGLACDKPTSDNTIFCPVRCRQIPEGVHLARDQVPAGLPRGQDFLGAPIGNTDALGRGDHSDGSIGPQKRDAPVAVESMVNVPLSV